MDIECGVRLTKEEVVKLLFFFDYSSDLPLHKGLDFDVYGEKLSKHAFFVIAKEEDTMLGFVAYYLNLEGHFVYIPQIVVHLGARHKGVGHRMLEILIDSLSDVYWEIRLEVLKDNQNARKFYEREGFIELAERDERLLLEKIVFRECVNNNS